MKKVIWILFFLLTPLTAFAAGITFNPTIESATIILTDPRLILLDDFFAYYKCPKPYMTEQYLEAAESYNLDYRLLPALSIRESSCGKHQEFNNWFGYGSATSLIHFKTPQDGIFFVAEQVSTKSVYHGTVRQILSRYGPYNNKDYPQEVINLMLQIDPVPIQ